MKEWQLSDNAAYVHYCPNETIDGIAIHEEPDFDDKNYYCRHFSSAIYLSHLMLAVCLGMIYAGAQKCGHKLLTLNVAVFILEDLLGKARKRNPSVFDYTVLKMTHV